MRVLHWVVPVAVMAGLVLAVPASASTPPIIILPPLPTVHRVLGKGRNDYGQLSANNTTTYISPVTALGLPDSISRIASGQLFSVAVTSGGAAYDWGLIGWTVEPSGPTVVAGISGAIRAAAGTMNIEVLVSQYAVIAY